MTYSSRTTDGSGSPKVMHLVSGAESEAITREFTGLQIGRDPDEAARASWEDTKTGSESDHYPIDED